MSDNSILLYTAVIASLGSLLTSFYTHIKHSKCLGMELNTRTVPPSPRISSYGAIDSNRASILSTAESLPLPFTVNTTASAPIDIPKLPPPPKNYL